MQRQGEREGGAAAERALDRDIAAHEAGKAPRDREPEAGAAVDPSAARVRLLELLENQAELVRRYAGARVGDGDRNRAVRRARLEADAAALGEFRGVAEEVDDDLPQLFFIDVHLGKPLVELLDQP